MAYTAAEFLNKIKPMVISDMKNTGILASLTAAQAFIESGKGNSKLTRDANNLFGIKGRYNGQYVQMWTVEYKNGKRVKEFADFRKYPSWAESISDHSSLFNRLSRYKNLRGEKNYITACKNVEKDGYATAEDGNGNPTYAKTLISTIEKYRLYEWDNEDSTPIDDPTDIAIDHPTLKKGDRNEYVRAWQIYLNSHGYSCGKYGADGIFGKDTEKAVKAYQKDRGLTPDGVIGSATWDSII